MCSSSSRTLQLVNFTLVKDAQLVQEIESYYTNYGGYDWTLSAGSYTDEVHEIVITNADDASVSCTAPFKFFGKIAFLKCF